MRSTRWPANLATLANGLVGAGAIGYTIAGNPLWAMLLIVAGVGFDGLDGQLARRSGLPPSRFGRGADSISDAVTFALAPAALLAIHTDHAAVWRPWAPVSLAVAGIVAALAIARLIYFTIRAYQRKDFLGVPTPQNALALIALLLFLDVPGFLGVDPPVVLALAATLAVTMVLPIEFPKIRRGSPLRAAMAVTAVAIVVTILPVQFRPSPDSVVFAVAEAAAVVAAAGLALYYVLGPFTLTKPPTAARTQ